MPSDSRPFPIQQGRLYYRFNEKECTIPWWLAEEAYKWYSKRFGEDQSLERLAERGGFGRDELLMMLRREA